MFTDNQAETVTEGVLTKTRLTKEKKEISPFDKISPFDTPIRPIHQPRNVEYNEVFLFLCTLEMF